MPPFTLLCTIRFTNKVFRLPLIDYAATCYRRILLPIIRANIWAWNLPAAKYLLPIKMWWLQKPLFDVDYSPLLQRGAVFAIMEGGKCVGMGRVDEVRFQAAV